MKITIVFPGRSLETAKATAAVMPLAPCLLAALTPAEHEIALVDMFFGDRVDYESDADMVALTVRTPLATIAYEIADKFLQRGKTVILGGPHIFACPDEAKRHATARALQAELDLPDQVRAVCRPEPPRHDPSRPPTARAEHPRADAAGPTAARALYDGFHLHDARLSQPLPILPRHRHLRGQDSPSDH